MSHQIQTVLNPDTPTEWDNEYGDYKRYEVVLVTGDRAEVSTKVKDDGTWYVPQAGDQYKFLAPPSSKGLLPKLKERQGSNGTVQQQLPVSATKGSRRGATRQRRESIAHRLTAQTNAVNFLQARVAAQACGLFDADEEACLRQQLTDAETLSALIDWFASDGEGSTQANEAGMEERGDALD